ncbi:MAG: hypothetical protein ABJI04_10650, partial [Marinomonas sp.]
MRRAKIMGLACAGALTVFAAPAHANTATADVAAPLEQQSTSLSSGDERFRQLFASWESLDESGPKAPVQQRPTVAIPSAMPLKMAKLTSGYGMRNHPVLGRRRNHKGVDLAAP